MARSRYLLPCPCGRKNPIEVAQSGQSIQCACGRRLDVPTMLEIRSLERVAEEPTPRRRRPWGIRQGLVLLGMLVTVVAACVALGLYLTRPTPPEPPSLQRVQAIISELSLLQTFWEWERLKGGLETGPQIIRQEYTKKRDAHHRWMAVAAVIGVLGVACAASSLLVPKPGKRG
mgnify:CR=1 FL=1